MIGFIILLIVWGIYYFVIKDNTKQIKTTDIPSQYDKLIEFLIDDPQAKISSKTKDYVFIDAKLGSTPVGFNLHFSENKLNLDLILKQNNEPIKTWKFDHNNQAKMIEQINSDMLNIMVSHFTKINKLIDDEPF